MLHLTAVAFYQTAFLSDGYCGRWQVGVGGWPATALGWKMAQGDRSGALVSGPERWQPSPRRRRASIISVPKVASSILDTNIIRHNIRLNKLLFLSNQFHNKLFYPFFALSILNHLPRTNGIILDINTTYSSA